MAPMESLAPEVYDAGRSLWSQIGVFFELMLLPWRLRQLAVILGLVLIAHLSRLWLRPKLDRWLRAQVGWPKWRLRLGLLVQRKLRVILFAVLAWVVVLVMREVTWPSRSQLIALAASIATAWVVIEFGVRIITNRFLRRIVRWGAWIWVTLYFLQLLDPATAVLDSVALTIGAYRLSILSVLQTLIVAGLLISLVRVLSRLITGSLARNADLSPSVRVLIGMVTRVLLFSLAILLGLKALGIDLTGLTVFSGAIGLGLGFGLQKVVSNLVSGIIILLDKSIKPGDVISLGETFGWIDSLGARYVSVVTRDGKEYLIPNEDLVTGQVVNWSHTNDFVRLDLRFGASYHDDPHVVSRLAIEAASHVSRVSSDRKPVCWITGFGDSSVEYLLRFWITDAQQGLTNVRGQVFLALWDAFRANNVTIPFPQREIRILHDRETGTTIAADEPSAADRAAAKRAAMIPTE
ncbi:mechanosensitive ion channel domain-containing protein [uncultured Paracoccus sp.]|uniref:mechanosensitive ion channel family protein n=1 Tax=uncultured Paracoccus sp. TaxID=189685 RepID=UPI002606F97D|nr:mechanosensitive ion channel domain-containing protein [uncultured Paracoccus sp.]